MHNFTNYGKFYKLDKYNAITVSFEEQEQKQQQQQQQQQQQHVNVSQHVAIVLQMKL